MEANSRRRPRRCLRKRAPPRSLGAAAFAGAILISAGCTSPTAARREELRERIREVAERMDAVKRGYLTLDTSEVHDVKLGPESMESPDVSRRENPIEKDLFEWRKRRRLEPLMLRKVMIDFERSLTAEDIKELEEFALSEEGILLRFWIAEVFIDTAHYQAAARSLIAWIAPNASEPAYQLEKWWRTVYSKRKDQRERLDGLFAGILAEFERGDIETRRVIAQMLRLEAGAAALPPSEFESLVPFDYLRIHYYGLPEPPFGPRAPDPALRVRRSCAVLPTILASGLRLS